MANTEKTPEGGQAYQEMPPNYQYTGPPPQGYGYGYGQGYYGMPPNPQQAGYYPPPVGVIIIQPSMPPPARGPTYMAESLFSCLCCFWPFGIAAVIVSFISFQAYNNGNVAKGERFGRLAGILSVTSIICGAIFLIIFLSVKYTVYNN